MNYTNNKSQTLADILAERFQIRFDYDISQREKRLCLFKKFYEATIYNSLPLYTQEYKNNSNLVSDYIPISQRRPGVIYNIPKIIVKESVSMLFGQSHFPFIRCDDENYTKFINYLVEYYKLPSTMQTAAIKGALGSVCLIVKVLNKKFYIEVLPTTYLTPVFKWDQPTVLEKITEKKLVSADSLMASGYTINSDDINEEFYLIREWDSDSETYYTPYVCSDEKKEGFSLKRDEKRSTIHSLGFVPAIWIKNNDDGDQIDGECTFEPIIDICIEINYQLSQGGRLLKYNADPTLVIENEDSLGGTIVKGKTIKLSEGGKAYLLEMNGDSSSAILEYVRSLREYALEVVRGNRANPDKISALHSGKALQMLNMSLLSLVEDMRLFYGECGLIPLIKMMIDIIKTNKYKIDLDDYSFTPNEKELNLSLEWPDFYPPTPDDDAQEAAALQTYDNMQVLSKETILKIIADKYNIQDIQKELETIKKQLTNTKNEYNNEKSNVSDGSDGSKSVVAEAVDE